MKKFFCLFLCVSLFTSMLCGCNGYTEIDSKYLVSAIGFDSADGKIQVFAEIISSDGETKENKILKATGGSAKEAVFNFGLELSKSLVVDHCAVLAIGENVGKDAFLDIMEFCRDVKNLNLGIYMIYCRDIEAVFSVPPSQTAIGYDIMELLKRRLDEDGVDYKNRFYEIQELRSNKSRVFSLPVISSKEDSLIIEGERVYKDSEFAILLDNTESAVYSIICDRFLHGNIFIGQESAHIYSAKTDFSVSKDESDLTVTFSCVIDTKKKTENFDASLKNAAAALISRAQNQTDADIFLISQNLFLKNSALFKEFKDKNAAFVSSKSTKIIYTLRQEKL